MKIATIVGARPQFVKLSPLSRAIRRKNTEILIHTGQHYDDLMSEIFFRELEIPPPDYNLEVGSGPHGWQTGAMLTAIEQVLMAVAPDWVLVYGDTNSTLSGALAAAKLHISVAHIESGMRSWNRSMPEEINRILADHTSNLLFCSSDAAVRNLAAEGITRGVHMVGDLMAGAFAWACDKARRHSQILPRLGLSERGYVLATIHRAENTDDDARLRSILEAFDAVGDLVVLPVHPRTRKVLDHMGYEPPPTVRLMDPVGYIDMAMLEQGARMLLTDSGGIQKEAYWLGIPCVTIRDETEWVETVEAGWNRITGADTSAIIDAVRNFPIPSAHPDLYRLPDTAERIAGIIDSSH